MMMSQMTHWFLLGGTHAAQRTTTYEGQRDCKHLQRAAFERSWRQHACCDMFPVVVNMGPHGLSHDFLANSHSSGHHRCATRGAD